MSHTFFVKYTNIKDVWFLFVDIAVRKMKINKPIMS